MSLKHVVHVMPRPHAAAFTRRSLTGSRQCSSVHRSRLGDTSSPPWPLDTGGLATLVSLEMTETRSSQAVLARLQQLEDVLTHATVGIAVTDLDGQIKLLNMSFAFLLAGREGIDDLARFRGRRLADWSWALDPTALSGAAEVKNKPIEILSNSGRRQALLDAVVRDVSIYWLVRPLLVGAVPSIAGMAESDAAEWAALVEMPGDGGLASASDSPEDLRARLELLEDFFEYAPAGMHIVGGDGSVLRSNANDRGLLGYDDAPEEYIGRHIAVAYADQQVLEALLDQLTHGRPVINFRAHLRTRDGRIEPVVIYSSGRLVGGEFANTRCFVFPDHEPESERTAVTSFSWPRG